MALGTVGREATSSASSGTTIEGVHIVITSDDSEIEKVIVDDCTRNQTSNIVGEHFFIGVIVFAENVEGLVV